MTAPEGSGRYMPPKTGLEPVAAAEPALDPVLQRAFEATRGPVVAAVVQVQFVWQARDFEMPHGVVRVHDYRDALYYPVESWPVSQEELNAAMKARYDAHCAVICAPPPPPNQWADVVTHEDNAIIYSASANWSEEQWPAGTLIVVDGTAEDQPIPVGAVIERVLSAQHVLMDRSALGMTIGLTVTFEAPPTEV